MLARCSCGHQMLATVGHNGAIFTFCKHCDRMCLIAACSHCSATYEAAQ